MLRSGPVSHAPTARQARCTCLQGAIIAAFSEGAAAHGRRARLPEAALCAIEGARACITQAGRRSIFTTTPAASAAPDLTMDLDEPARTKRAVLLAQVRRIPFRKMLARAPRMHSHSDALSSAPLASRRHCKSPPDPPYDQTTRLKCKSAQASALSTSSPVCPPGLCALCRSATLGGSFGVVSCLSPFVRVSW